MSLYISPSQFLQATFVMAASTIVLINSIPSLRARLVVYGPRATPDDTATSASSVSQQATQTPRGYIEQVVDGLSELQVPHSYFKYFYLVSVLSSTFWLVQLLFQGSVLTAMCQEEIRSRSPDRNMSLDQLYLSWSLMAFQGVRRLFESISLMKKSASSMWFVHWLLGMAFYLAVGVGIWIHGAEPSLATNPLKDGIAFSVPSLRTAIALPVFVLASGIQYSCHVHLASLPKYTLPTHPMFQSFVCPHYSAECLIYLSLAVISAPKDAWINTTMFAAFIFVAVNLSVTAASSKEWYERKFGRKAMASRWTMMPGVW